jgi:hypothetical protein
MRRELCFVQCHSDAGVVEVRLAELTEDKEGILAAPQLGLTQTQALVLLFWHSLYAPVLTMANDSKTTSLYLLSQVY